MRRRNALAAACSAAVLLVACSSSDGEPDASDAPVETAVDGSVDVGGDDGGDDGADGGAGDAAADQGSPAAPGSDRPESVRDDYPIPFPPGWEKDIQGEIGMTNVSGAQLLYPTDAFDSIVAFYDEWFESQPDEFARTVAGEQVVYQQLGETLYQVAVNPTHEEGGEIWVILQVSGGAVD